MADETPVASRGLFESLTRLASSLVAIGQSRLELLSTDVEEARSHAFSLMMLGVSALFFLGLGVGLATVFLVVAFWDTERLLVLGALAGVYLAVGVAIAAVATRRARRRYKPFAASLAELHKDRQRLSDRS
jgi:uncharacterized membrane protein YqjE